MRCVLRRAVLLALLGTMPAIASDRIGDIEFFGYKGLDVAKIRELLLYTKVTNIPIKRKMWSAKL